MKKITFIICLLFSSSLVAQNRISYSQYMHNLGVFNPAYFSVNNKVVATSYLREQWAGMKGAPTTKSLVAGVDINDKQRIHLNIYQDAITVFNDVKIGLGYNYRIALSKRTLFSFGIKGDVGFIDADYSSLISQDPDEVLLNANFESQKYMNIGAGLFVQSANYFVGFSMPHLFKNSIDKSKDAILNSRLKFNHTYLSMGNKFEFKTFTFTPTALVKTVSGSPLQLDLNANFLVKEQVWLSGGYRSTNELILSIGFVMFKNFKLVYSYDFSFFSSTNPYSGTHEVSVGYGISFYKKYMGNKRKFLKRNKKFKKK
jgi:type IX secretion system PorP/SprF family membrane protein